MRHRAGWKIMASAACALFALPAMAESNWPQFRGPQARGYVDGARPPAKWDAPKGENVHWKTPIPGLGHSSPIIWGDRVFLTTAVSGKADDILKVGLYGNIAPVEDDSVHEWKLLCLDRQTGKVLWDRTPYEGVPKIKRHTKSTHANSTPATDGKYVVSFFGSEGLACYDFDGKLLWQKDLGKLDAGYYMVPEAQWGFGSSPIIYKDMVIVQCDVQGPSFLAAFDVKTGEKIWYTPRDEVPTWSTPTVYEDKDRTQVICNGYKHIGSYDVRTGKEIWKLVGGGDIPVPTPVVAHDLIYITNAHGAKAPVYAVRVGAKGNITPGNPASSEAIAWSYDRRGSYMQTPLAYRGRLYAARDNGVLTVYDAQTGEIAYRKRLGDGGTGFTASPIAGDGKVYYTSETGEIHVLDADSKGDVLSVNSMGEVCMATPAISGDTIFVRTQHHLFAIGD